MCTSHRLIVEEVTYLARRWLPANVPHRACLTAPVLVPVGFSHVVVMPSLCAPGADGMGVERPVWNVDAVDAIHERAIAKAVRGQPLGAVPAPDPIAYDTLGDLERKEALRANRGLDLVVGKKFRGPAEIAVL